MKRIEFSEMTNRLRRNLMAVAALIIVIVYFEIRVGRAAAQGMELEGLTTDVVLWILVALLVYHFLAFTIRGTEEYEHWKLTFFNEQATAWGGGQVIVDIARQLRDVSTLLENITANSGAIASHNQGIISPQDAAKLKRIAPQVENYAKKFKNFPAITAIRFWAWDIGVAGIVAATALWFAIGWLSTSASASAPIG